MADIIKYIASFSEDAIHNAIEQAVGAEKEYFIDMLMKIAVLFIFVLAG